ncbi:hypothetical protein [Mucilaginibacter arboris]|uniref:Uncharacterized protein n=1 Tax=Mucilaginibacter arboris TaxID=2682090 RepID=A0A7K1SYJ4_9SPHI|nr:hypothetical protein [Mucilaginibacter arboris]MVN22100.1 hypothetical protein [Mucilaginibacter arboris]
MILNEEQKSIIRTLVSNEVCYQETYLEVYDHIMSTLETRDSINDFQKAYAEVLEEDFGGHSGIEKLEEIRERLIRKEITQRKWNFFREFFKGPGIIVSLSAGVFCYYGFHIKHFAYWLFCITGLMTVLPFFFLSIGNFFIGLKKKEKENKKSINDDALYSAAVMIFRFIVRLQIISFLLNAISFFNRINTTKV